MFKKKCFFSIYFILLIQYNCKSQVNILERYGGFEISHQWVSDSTWKFKLNIYTNCRFTDSSLLEYSKYNWTDTCNYQLPPNLIAMGDFVQQPYLPNGLPTPSKANLPCNVITQCDTLNPNYLTGYKWFYFEKYITLAEKCGLWHIAHISSTNNSRRDSNITNLERFFIPAYGGNMAGDKYFVCTDINFSDTSIKSNSCKVINPRPVFVNQGVPIYYSFAAQDIDGDSLVYRHVTSKKKQTAGTPMAPIQDIPFVIPFTLSEPFATNGSFKWDSLLGIMSFTAAYSQNPLITMVIDEYRNGVWVGSSMYDVPIVISSANDPQPIHALQPATFVNVSLQGNDSLIACAGQPINFCSLLSSTNPNAHLLVTDSLNPLMPGASLNYTGMATNNVQACVSWSPTIADTGWHVFTLTVRDTLCPVIINSINSPQTYPIYIYIAPPAVSIQGNTSLCFGDSLLLTASGGNGVYTWSTLNGMPNNYSCITGNCDSILVFPVSSTAYVANSGNNIFCNNSDTLQIFVAKDFTLHATDTTICENGINSITLSANASGNNTQLLYQWFPLTNILGNNNQSTISILPSLIQYTVSATDSAGCFIHIDSASVLYDSNFQPIVSVSPDNICAGDTAWLSVINVNNATLLWSPAQFLSATNQANFFAVPSQDMVYTLHSTSNISQCTHDTSVAIIVSKVFADAGNDVTISFGEKVKLGGPNMLVCPTCSILWQPNYNLHYPYSIYPFAFPEHTTTYWVIVKNQTETCVSTDSVTVYVNCNNLFMANIFNPNSDIENNKTFGPNNRSLQLVYFKIYNRRGQLVFSSKDANERWDGNFKNEPAPMETYYWMMKGKCLTGGDFFRKGDVILLR